MNVDKIICDRCPTDNTNSIIDQAITHLLCSISVKIQFSIRFIFILYDISFVTISSSESSSSKLEELLSRPFVVITSCSDVVVVVVPAILFIGSVAGCKLSLLLT